MPSRYLFRKLLVMKNSDSLCTHGFVGKEANFFASAGDNERWELPPLGDQSLRVFYCIRVEFGHPLCVSLMNLIVAYDFSHRDTRVLRLCSASVSSSTWWVQGALLPASVLRGHYVFSSGAWLGGLDYRQAGVCPCILMPFLGNRTLMGDRSIEWQIQE